MSHYNVYINGEKHNAGLIIELFYTVTGLETNTLYDVAISTVATAGNVSELMGCHPVKGIVFLRLIGGVFL